MGKTLECGLAPGPVPEHIAIIMDGNGRWAGERGLARVEGHRAGAESLREVIAACGDWGVRCLTVYAFSTENWKRPPQEVEALMLLLEQYLQSQTAELERNDIALRVIGDIAGLPQGARVALEAATRRLAHCKGRVLTLALNYGGRDEMVRAVRALAARVAAGELAPGSITADTISAALDTAGLPDPDLIIRTAGEMRLSNFLLWQASYAELYSTPLCWPDFRRAALAEAIEAYRRRTRKFGAVFQTQ